MTVLTFSMVGIPRGKGTARAAVRGRFATIYSDPATRKYERSVAKAAQALMGGRAPLEGALSLSVRFRLPVPASTSKRLRAAMLAGEVAPAKKPDLSNLLKAIEDGMNGVVFVDDCQICRGFQTKIYAEQPGVDVRVEAYAPQDSDPPRASLAQGRAA